MYNNCCCDLVVYNKMWKTVNVSMPFPAYGMSSGVICGKLYVAGGLKVNNDQPFKIQNNLQVYCPTHNEWWNLSSMIKGVFGASSCVIDNKLYVIGGIDGIDSFGGITNITNITTTSIVQVYCPFTNTWTLIDNLNKGVGGQAIGVINGKIYIAGGFDGTIMTPNVQVYE